MHSHKQLYFTTYLTNFSNLPHRQIASRYFYSMIIGNTVHFIHLAYPTNIVTDIRNYNHFNPKELNPILKLAICEDNPSHYEIIHTILQKYPPGAFEITHFASGDEFLRTVAENGCPYSIVLTDIDLGSDNVNGISLAEKINYISPDTQIILSASICNMLPQYMRQNMPTLSINSRWKSIFLWL